LGVKELPRLVANHDAFAACFILDTHHPHNERNVGIDVQIAVCTDTLAEIVVLCPAVNGHLYDLPSARYGASASASQVQDSIGVSRLAL
jgi:hypothetical protein